MKKFILFLLVAFTLFPLCALDPYRYPVSTLFIDPGHGGKDSGAVREWDFGTVQEKDINLAVSLLLRDYLTEKAPDLNVLMTRDTDVFYSLAQRGDMCYQTVIPPHTSVLYLSLHANASDRADASGFEVYIRLKERTLHLFDDTTPLLNIPFFSNSTMEELNQGQIAGSLSFAKTLDSSLASAFPAAQDRGVKEEDLYVLNGCRSKGALVELGFISNRNDALQLINPQWQEKAAKALGDAIIASL